MIAEANIMKTTLLKPCIEVIQFSNTSIDLASEVDTQADNDSKYCCGKVRGIYFHMRPSQ